MSAPHGLSAHEPLLVNLLGHSAGALVFGLFCALLLKGPGRVPRRPLAAAALAFFWNLGSLIVLAVRDPHSAAAEWVVVLATAALSLLPAVLLDISLGGTLRYLPAAGYALSVAAVAAHASEPFFPDFDLHRQTLLVTSYGFAGLTLLGGWAAPRRLAAMALLLFSLSFVHFHTAGAQDVWTLELLVHHAGIPLALLVLLQDYRFVLLDAFVRVLANFLLAALLSLAAGEFASSAGWLSPALADPRRQALALVTLTALLAAFALARRWVQDLLTRLWFRHEDTERAAQHLRDGARRHAQASAYLEWAQAEMARLMNAALVEQPDPAGTLVPIRLGPEDTRELRLGRRAGGRRFLSQDLRALSRWADVVASEWNAFRERELRELMSQAELKALQAQIHPHFLFNALNTLYGVIPKEATGARRTVLNLADIFRYFLRTDRTFIPFASELEIVRAYLEIEQLRLGPKLRTSLGVDPAAHRILIPVLSVQPLVENAVKHGVAAQAAAGDVRLDARVSGGYLEVAVTDSGPGFSPRDNAGVGLDNVRRRLQLCYGPASALAVESTPQGTRVSFRAPLAPVEVAR